MSRGSIDRSPEKLEAGARPDQIPDHDGIVTVADGAETTVAHFAVTKVAYDELPTSPNRVRGREGSTEYSIAPPHSGRDSHTL